MKDGYRVAVVGATGAVGNTMIRVLEERDFPVRKLTLLASARSAGMKLQFKGQEIRVEELDENSFKQTELALFSAGASVSKRFAPIAASDSCVVVDNSSAFRMETDIPLVVPEVNPYDVEKHAGIIANPNCSTIQMVVALKPIYDEVGIKRIVVSTYQAVSGTGKRAMEELSEQIRAIVDGKTIENEVYPHQIAFNCLPHIGKFLPNGYTEEEMKMVNETRKILGDSYIQVSATTVRVPVYYGHSETVNIETRKKITAEQVRALLGKAPGIKVLDNPEKFIYPMPLAATGRDETFVGRIRQDTSIENGIDFWVVADNIRKGAATNAVQIAELLNEKKLIKRK